MKGTNIIIVILSILSVTGIILFFTQRSKVSEARQQLASKVEQYELLEKEADHLRSTNGSLLGSMADLSVVSKTGAESIKQSLESLATSTVSYRTLRRRYKPKIL